MSTLPSFRYRWQIGANVMAGAPSRHWKRLLKAHGWDSAFWPRVALLRAKSVLNTAAERRELATLGPSIQATEVTQPPIFLLGHWRSGTTFLHYFFTQDPGMGYVSTHHVFNPYSQRRYPEGSRMKGASQRKMDRVLRGPELPHEDDFAIAARTTCSPFVGYVFPRAAATFDRYLDFAETTSQERESWKAALRWTVQKATLLQSGKPIVLKSPPHMGRIRLILETFPKARFIHLHRHPFEVMQSLMKLNHSLPWNSVVQIPDVQQTIDTDLRRYRILFEAFFRDVSLIPQGQFFEVPFSRFETHPVATLGEAYEALGISGFQDARRHFEAFKAQQAAYAKNRHLDLSETMKEAIVANAGGSFERWGYSRSV